MESNSLISIYGYGTSNMFLLRGIYICNRYFQIYPTISHASTEFNSRWLLPLLLIASPFWHKKGECCLLGHAKLLHIGGLFLCHLEDGSCGDGDSCPQLSTWPPGLWGCGTRQRFFSATLLHIFTISSPFMFSYLQVVEKLLLDFKMVLKINLFICSKTFQSVLTENQNHLFHHKLQHCWFGPRAAELSQGSGMEVLCDFPQAALFFAPLFHHQVPVYWELLSQLMA